MKLIVIGETASFEITVEVVLRFHVLRFTPSSFPPLLEMGRVRDVLHCNIKRARYISN